MNYSFDDGEDTAAPAAGNADELGDDEEGGCPPSSCAGCTGCH